MKKGEMSLQLIVGVVIVLIIAAILIYLIMNHTKTFDESLKQCPKGEETTKDECISSGGTIIGKISEDTYCCFKGFNNY